jgi:hypothetical protein
MTHADGYGRPNLRWSRDGGWLHKPTGEVVPDSDPRVPKTVDAKKRQPQSVAASAERLPPAIRELH